MNKWLRDIHLVLIPQNWDRGRYCFSRAAPGARRARCTRRPIVLPLYIECYFGWFIDETLSSLLVRYRLFLLFFYVLPTECIESDALDHRQHLSSLRSLRHTRFSSSSSFSPHFSHSISSFRVTSPCHFLPSPPPSARTGRLHISTFGRF